MSRNPHALAKGERDVTIVTVASLDQFQAQPKWEMLCKGLVALVIVHAIINLTIFTTVLLASGMLHDASGRPISPWFFL